MTLNNRQQIFISEYLKCWNASEAARRAGYNGKANIVGPRLLKYPVIKQAILDKISTISKQTSNEVIQNSILQLPVKNKKKSTPNKVYFIQAENGLIKIGIASNVKTRLNELNVGSPIELKLLFVIESEDAKSIEYILHTFFKSKRVKGEWFRLSEFDISFVKNNYGIKS